MMPPSFYCKPRWIKAGGRSTGHSLAPSTQIQFMNNQSKKCLSEQHCYLIGPLNILSQALTHESASKRNVDLGHKVKALLLKNGRPSFSYW